MKNKWVSFALSAALAFTAIAAPCRAETAGLGLNAETCLTRLMDAITVIAQYRFFNIVEP